jgi:midasin
MSHSIVTVAPSSFNVAIIFSASSFGTDSFMTFGAASTNFFESTKLKPSSVLTSLMTLGLAPASKDCSLTVNKDFSCAAGAASSASSAAAAAGVAADAGAAKPPIGRSGMLSRVCEK